MSSLGVPGKRTVRRNSWYGRAVTGQAAGRDIGRPLDCFGVPVSSVDKRRSWGVLLAGVAVAGGVGWLVDTTLLWLLDTQLGVPTPLAAALGFLAAGVVNFVLNRLVFRARGRTRNQSLRYVLLFLVNLVVVATVVPLLSHLLDSTIARDGVRIVVAKLLTTAALLPFNTMAYHHWVFAAPRETQVTP
jgi:putative flippase GtrA